MVNTDVYLNPGRSVIVLELALNGEIISLDTISVVGNVQRTLGGATSGNRPDLALNLQSPFYSVLLLFYYVSCFPRAEVSELADDVTSDGVWYCWVGGVICEFILAMCFVVIPSSI
jgi:hypothetical protein